MLAISWAMRAIIQGRYPSTQHDGSPWLPGDWRGDLAGKPLRKGVLVWIKGDLMEQSVTFGLRGLGSTFSPCFMCRTLLETLHAYDSVDLDGDIWGQTDELHDYELQCQQLEHIVVLSTEADRRKIYVDGGLYWDKRKNGVRGRALLRDVPSLGLRAGDRLTPSPQLCDVGDFTAAPLPIVLRFWRPTWHGQACMDPVLNRNPVFSPDLYTSPALTFALDVLHILYLGVHSRCIAAVIWGLIDANVFGALGPSDVAVPAILERLSCILQDWYDDEDVPQNYRVQEISVNMIGSREYPMLKTMGSETNALLPWALWLCQKYGDRLEYGFVLTEACRSLLGFMEVLKGAPAAIDRATASLLLELCIQHNHWMDEADVPKIFKNNFLAHLARRSVKHGNPLKSATFLDETLNLPAAVAASRVHRSSWERRLFERVSLQGEMAIGQQRFFYGGSS